MLGRRTPLDEPLGAADAVRGGCARPCDGRVVGVLLPFDDCPHRATVSSRVLRGGWGVAGWNTDRLVPAPAVGGCGGFGTLLGPEETPGPPLIGGWWVFFLAAPGLDHLTRPGGPLLLLWGLVGVVVVGGLGCGGVLSVA